MKQNLFVAEQVYWMCINVSNISTDCGVCDKHIHIFRNDPAGSLLEYLHGFEEKN